MLLPQVEVEEEFLTNTLQKKLEKVRQFDSEWLCGAAQAGLASESPAHSRLNSTLAAKTCLILTWDGEVFLHGTEMVCCGGVAGCT